MKDAHPLHPALITPADEPYQVDELSRRVHTRDGRRVPPSVRALPTAATTVGVPGWKWGRPVDRPTSNSGAPLIMSPTDLEKRSPAEPSSHPSLTDYVRRLRP